MFIDSSTAWPLEPFHTGTGSDFACCAVELFRATERIDVRATAAVHYLRSRSIACQLPNSLAFHFEHFGEIFQRQCHIPMHTESIVATIHRLRGTLHRSAGNREFLSFLENRKAAVADWLRTRTGPHFNAWQSKKRNRLQSHDSRIDLGRIYGMDYWTQFNFRLMFG